MTPLATARFAWRRVLLVLAVAIGGAALLYAPTVHAALTDALTAVERVAANHAGWAAALVVACSAAAAVLAFFSSWLIVPFAVYTWGPTLTLTLLLMGWMLGGAASYALARRFGRPVARWLGLEPLLARYEDLVSHRTPFALALLVQLALPAEVRGPLFGLGRYPVGRYLIAVLLADLPYAVVSVYAGAAVVTGRPALLAAAAAVFVGVSGGAWYALQRRLHAGTHRRGLAPPATEEPLIEEETP